MRRALPLFLAIAVLGGALFVVLNSERKEGDRRASCLERVAPPIDGAYVRAIRREGTSRRVYFTDGSDVQVPADPRRIVSTLPGLTETVHHLGAFNRLVAVSPHCNEPAAVEDLARVSVLPLDGESLVQLQPDLVLIDRVLLPQGAEELRGLGLTALPVESRSLAHLRATVDLLAAIFDTREARARAARFGARLERALAAAALPAGRVPPRVLLLAQTDPVYALGPRSLLDDMVRVCGAVNIACDLGRASGPFDEELVLVRQPDVLLVLDSGLPEGLRRRWRSLPAIRDGRVTVLNSDQILRAGPRSPEALEEVAKAIHAHEPESSR